MEKTLCDKMFFIGSIHDYDASRHPGCIVHILCIQGSMSFYFQNVYYNIVAGDYVILTNMSLAGRFSQSADYQALTLVLSEAFVTSMAIRSNYGIIGHLALLQNPVIKLSPDDFLKCKDDLLRLRERLNDMKHLFREEMLGHLLMAHILDLYDIHAREQVSPPTSERVSTLLRQFIEMLYNGEYMHHRDVPYYASHLCITPHYLTEICKKASGKTATYWIERFTIHTIMSLLCQKDLLLTEIADRLHFSSMSYFSRYVQQRIGVSPTEYRNSLSAKNASERLPG